MGFFAVVHPSEKGRAFAVKKCHLNFFAIRPSLGSNLSYLLDVGLLVGNLAEGGVDCEVELLVVIPLAATSESFADLGPMLLDPKIAANIFGEPVTVDDKKCITLRSSIASSEKNGQKLGKFRVFLFAPDSMKREDSFSGVDASVWRLKIAFSDGVDTYVRMRFKLDNPGRLMQSVQSGSSGGTLVDFRVSDVRGADAKGAWDSLEPKMAKIEFLNFFLITSVDFHMLFASPSLRYTRLLEPMVWKKYLDVQELETLVAYHWNKEGPITPEMPFHVFGRLETQGKMPDKGMQTSDLIRVGLVCMVASLAAMGIAAIGARLKAEDVLAWIREHLWPIVISTTIIILAILVAVKKYVELIEFYKKHLSKLKARLASWNAAESTPRK